MTAKFRLGLHDGLLTHVRAGQVCEDEGVVYPQHGRVNHLPASQVRHDGAWHGEPGQLAMPYVTIEAVVVQDPRTLVIVNDNNDPFSVGRHLGTRRTDDNDWIRIRLAHALPH